MERETGILVVGLVGATLIVGFIVLIVGGTGSSWFVPDDGPQRDVGLTCVDSDPGGSTNVTYVPFESLSEREQNVLKPALEEGSVLITDEESAVFDHRFIEYENQTYRCSTSVP